MREGIRGKGLREEGRSSFILIREIMNKKKKKIYFYFQFEMFYNIKI